jgi:tRNA-dihydrouridine synthase A
MVDRTDRHFRYLLRGITRRTLLYTEMVVARAVTAGRADAMLAHDPVERPLALQLAGDDPTTLAAAARRGEADGFAEINLNCGCPSSAAHLGRFGVVLMKDPAAVAAAVAAMRAAVSVPVTVKTRLGVDDLDDDDALDRFVAAIAEAGADRLIVHARKAWLGGLSPARNRSVPPLQPDRVVALAQRWPTLRIELNGGLADLVAARRAVAGTPLTGAMVGRAAWDDPWIFAHADTQWWSDPEDPAVDRQAVLARMVPYAERRAAAGDDPRRVLRSIVGLLRGRPGARGLRAAVLGRGDTEALRRACAPAR